MAKTEQNRGLFSLIFYLSKSLEIGRFFIKKWPKMAQILRGYLILLWHSKIYGQKGSNGACSVRRKVASIFKLFELYGASSVATFIECQSRTKPFLIEYQRQSQQKHY